MVKVIGITGSIACGKSTVTDYLRNKGYEVIDADEISRHALDIGSSCYYRVIELFGCMANDGSVDRKELGNIVFNDNGKKELLESIIHPYVIDEINKGICNTDNDIIFLDIPLLYEAHLEYLCDKIIVVYVNEELQMNRLMKRNNIDRNGALLLMSKQISIEIKKDKADYIIDNQYDLNHLYNEIEKVLKEVDYENIYE